MLFVTILAARFCSLSFALIPHTPSKQGNNNKSKVLLDSYTLSALTLVGGIVWNSAAFPTSLRLFNHISYLHTPAQMLINEYPKICIVVILIYRLFFKSMVAMGGGVLSWWPLCVAEVGKR